MSDLSGALLRVTRKVVFPQEAQGSVCPNLEGGSWQGWGRTGEGTEVTGSSFLCFSCPDNPCHPRGGSARALARRAAGCGCSRVLESFRCCDVLIVHAWVKGFRWAERGHSLDRRWPGFVLGWE